MLPPSRYRAVAALNAFVLLFAGSALLGVHFSYDPGLSLDTIAALLGGVTLYLLLANWARPRALLRSVALLTLVVAVGYGLYLISQYGFLHYSKGGVIVRLGDDTTLLPNLHGFIPQSNAAAALLEAAVPLGIGLTLDGRAAIGRAATAAATVIVLYATFLTASRGAWLALATTGTIAGAIVLARRLPHRSRAGLAIAGVSAATMVLLAIVLLGPHRLPILASTFSRATDRITLYRNSLYLAGDYPFTGIGLGDTFGMVYSRFDLLINVPFLMYPHNLILSVWLNQGLLGLVALVGMECSFYLAIATELRRRRSDPLFQAAWLAVTTVLLHGLTDAPQYAEGSHYVMPMLFVAMGVSIGCVRLAADDKRALVPISSWLMWLVSILGAISAVSALGVMIIPPVGAAWHTNRGAIAETRAELTPGLSDAARAQLDASAQTEYERALSLDPGISSANRRLGNLLVKTDRFDEAVPYLEAAYPAEHDNPAAIKGLGLAYVWVGRVQDAARLLINVRSPSDMPAELRWWAFYRTQQGRPLLAAYAYETLFEMYPRSSSPNEWMIVADAYRKAGHLDQARQWYERVIAVEPTNSSALNGLREISRP